MLLIFFVAIALSMDAFSLSLAYGTLGFSSKNRYHLSLIVGIYHFFMPLLGLFLGNYILSIIKIQPNQIAFVILLFIGVEMLISSFKKNAVKKNVNYKDFLIFGFAVSIDSFSVGIGLNALSSNFILSSFIFAISSFVFTWLGLNLGYRVNKLLNGISTIFGGILLIVISFHYLFT